MVKLLFTARSVSDGTDSDYPFTVDYVRMDPGYRVSPLHDMGDPAVLDGGTAQSEKKSSTIRMESQGNFRCSQYNVVEERIGR
jgi:hypothetical protein